MLMVRATEIVDQPVAAYLGERGYHFIAKLDNSVFFQEKDFCFCDRDFEEGPRKAELAMATVFDNGEKPRLSASNLSYGDGLQQYHERARSFSDRAGIE
jgi:hypothetical protein